MSAFLRAAFSVVIRVVTNRASPAANKARTRAVGRRLLRGQKKLYLNSCVCFSVKKKKKRRNLGDLFFCQNTATLQMLPTQTLWASQLTSADQGHGGTSDVLSIPLQTGGLLSGLFDQNKPMSKSRSLPMEGMLKSMQSKIHSTRSYVNWAQDQSRFAISFSNKMEFLLYWIHCGING